MKYMEMMGQDTDFVTNLSKKLSPPLVTLLSSEPEVRTYVLYLELQYRVHCNPSFTPVSRFNR
jgi:vesicle coat complex subunit